MSGRLHSRSLSEHERPQKQRAEWLLVLGLPLLFVVAWLLSLALRPARGPNVDYYLGVVGGLMMLALFLYPLRKHARFMRGFGPVKFWFASHMALGILAPLVILVHSGFRAGSVNASVALGCMLVVMLSGVVGRFIYRRIHHGLYGERATLEDLQGTLRLNSAELRTKLFFSHEAEETLLAFESAALAPRKGLLRSAWGFATVGLRARMTYARCRLSIAQAVAGIARERAWPDAERRRYRRALTRLVRGYIRNVQNVAQFAVYERLFSLWHVLHVPLVYLLVGSAIAHVVAVHMY
jgi:hypothetical protein